MKRAEELRKENLSKYTEFSSKREARMQETLDKHTDIEVNKLVILLDKQERK